MSITIKEIATIAGCSATTVSKVLNGREMGISESTKAKILSIADEHHYVPNMMAKTLRGQKTYTIGFMLPDITSGYFSKITRGIEDTARKRGFNVVFYDTDNMPERVHSAISFFTSRMVDGIILDQVDFPKDLRFLPRDIPIVITDRLIHGIEAPGINTGRVYSDTLDAIHTITRLHILSGSNKIAYIASKPITPFDRYYGYAAALKEADIEINEDLLYWGRYEIETGAKGIEHFISNGIDFDSVICSHDLIAVGAMDALKSHGISIPEKVRISGVGDIAFVRYLTPSLTTVSQFSYDMGEVAANMLIDNIVDGKPLSQKKIEYEIIRRESL